MSTGSSPVFPTINYFCPINYLINNINFNSKNKKFFFKIRITKKMINFLKIFKKYNLISSFYLSNLKSKNIIKTYAYIFPSYNKLLNINFFFKSFYLKNRRLTISIKALFSLKKRTGNSIYLISTSYGIITHLEALSLKKSGFLIGFIHS